jgi:hypothetical protein
VEGRGQRAAEDRRERWEGRGKLLFATFLTGGLAWCVCAGAAKCMAKGRAITEFGAKQKYMAKISDALKHCPYKVWHPSTLMIRHLRTPRRKSIQRDASLCPCETAWHSHAREEHTHEEST